MEKIKSELFWFSEPLIKAASSEEELILFFEKFGFELESSDVSSVFVAIESVSDLVRTILNEPNEDDDSFNLESLVSFFDGVMTFSQNVVVADYFGTDFLIEVVDFLLYAYLRVKQPFVLGLLKVLGVAEYSIHDESVRDLAFVQYKFNWKRIGELFKDHKNWAKDVYGWNGDPTAGDPKSLDHKAVLNALSFLVESSGLGLVYKKKLSGSDASKYIDNYDGESDFYYADLPLFQRTPNALDANGDVEYETEAGIKFLPHGDLRDIKNLGFALAPYIKGATSEEIELSDKLNLNISLSAELSGGLQLIISPKGVSSEVDGHIDAGFEFELVYSDFKENKPIRLLSIGDTAFIELESVNIAIGGDTDGDFYISAGVRELMASIDLSQSPLLGNFCSEPIEIPVESFLLKYSLQDGISVEGGFGTSFKVPANITIGPIQLTSIEVDLDIENAEIAIGFAANIDWNAIQLSIEGVGISASLTEAERAGALGKYDLNFGIQPPSGIGVSVNTPVVSGGGYLYLDHEKGEYAGVGEISIKEVLTVSAIAIITTKPPAGAAEPGFSLLIIISAQLPPIQLGFGFTLNGIGGLFAANRTMDLEALRSGVSNGTIDNLLFPTDPVKNAPQIIDQMGTIFPIAAGEFTFGVMAKLGWGTPTLISLELGLIIDTSGDAAILGVLKAILPEEDTPILALVVSFIGAVESRNQLITFDASLEGSQLLGMKLYGEMAFRLRWGNDPMFLLSVGGFHPEYTPPATIDLPSTFRRITLEILPENPKLTLTGYFAITPNTLQFGAGVDMYLKKGKFNITGFCKFNTLIQFNPFYLSISLDAGLSVKWDNLELLGVDFGGSLKGPGPWIANGYAEFRVVIKIKVNVNVKFGDRLETNQPTIEVLQLILDELAINENYEVLFPSESKILATSKYEENGEEASEEEKLLLHPAGKLSFKQLKVPLNVDLEKIGTRFVKGDKNFTLTMTDTNDKEFETENIKENFAPGEFFDLGLDQKLSRPSFEKYDGGITISDEAFEFSDDLEMELEYEQDLIDVIEDEENGGFKDRPTVHSLVGIDKGFFDKARSVNTIHNQNKVTTRTASVKENAVSVQTPELSLAYDGNSSEGTFSNFNAVYSQKNTLLNNGEFNHQEIIPKYELFD